MKVTCACIRGIKFKKISHRIKNYSKYKPPGKLSIRIIHAAPTPKDGNNRCNCNK